MEKANTAWIAKLGPPEREVFYLELLDGIGPQSVYIRDDSWPFPELRQAIENADEASGRFTSVYLIPEM